MHLTRNQLKILAIIAMAVDHVGATLFPQYFFMRLIGRLTFPIIVFFIAEGAFYTHNRPKYALRLLAFAFISEVPFDLCFFNKTFYFDYQNVFFTLFFGLMGVYLLDISKKYFGKFQFLGYVLVIIPAVMAEWAKTDYGGFGVLAIVVVYCLRTYKIPMVMGYFAVTFAMDLVRMLEYGHLGIEYISTYGFFFILLYHSEKLVKSTSTFWRLFEKYAFYIFYPGHLLIIYGIERLL